jgi:hypothetical protein
MNHPAASNGVSIGIFNRPKGRGIKSLSAFGGLKIHMQKKEAKMKKVIIVFLLIALIGVFTALQTPVAQTKSKGDLILTSKKVKSAPGDAVSSVWNQAKEAKIVLTGAGKFEGKVIELITKSVFTKDQIFFRFAEECLEI